MLYVYQVPGDADAMEAIPLLAWCFLSLPRD
jgi:hypothetical protein